MAVIGGRWKATILCKLHMKGPLRFNQIMRELEAISPRILTKQLREMEDDGLVLRTVRAEAPASVEYSLSERGRTLIPALRILAAWGNENMFRCNVHIDEGAPAPAATPH